MLKTFHSHSLYLSRTHAYTCTHYLSFLEVHFIIFFKSSLEQKSGALDGIVRPLTTINKYLVVKASLNQK